MASIDSYIATIEANLDYDLVGGSAGVTKAVAFISALRAILIKKPVKVTIGGDPVEFESLKTMLDQALAWHRANAPAASGGSGQPATYTYDISDVRR